MELQQNERLIDIWKLLYRAPDGNRYTGKLTVTSRRLVYDAEIDVSVKDKIDEALFIKWGSENFVVIPRERIRAMEVSKKFFSKKVILTLDNGSKHTFDHGMLDIDPVARAIAAGQKDLHK
jgi:hypothetical protein